MVDIRIKRMTNEDQEHISYLRKAIDDKDHVIDQLQVCLSNAESEINRLFIHNAQLNLIIKEYEKRKKK